MNVTIPCICPPTADGEPRHAQDTVVLRDKLDFPTAVLVQKSIQVRSLELGARAGATAEIMAFLTTLFVHHSIDSWSVVDAKAKPVEPTDDAITTYLEPNLDAALTIADAADALYMEAILPLVRRAFGSSPTTSTTGSTSPKTPGSATPRKPSKRSSISTIPMVVTGAITGSPAGVSRSLPSSASAD